MNTFIKRLSGLLPGFALSIPLLLSNSVQAQTTNPIYIDGVYTVAAGANVQWYGDVTLGPNAQLYIEDGARIYFYGTNLTMQPGAKVYGANSAWNTLTMGEGTGKISFIQPNPNTGTTVQQTLNGGWSAGSGDANTITSVEISNPQGVRLQSTAARMGTNLLFTSGHLFLGTLDARLDTTATITGADNTKFAVTAGSGHLVKEAYTGAFGFPVGIAVGDYTPAAIAPTATNTVHVNVATYSSSAALEMGTDGIQRTWNIYGDNTAGASVSLQHNSSTNQADFLPGAHFVTRYGNIPNTTGTSASPGPWQINAQGAGTTGSVANSSVRSLSYSSLTTSDTAKASFYTKASSTINPLDDARPNLSPSISFLPSTIIGTQTVNVVVKVYEFNDVATTGLISVYIPKSSTYTLSYNPAATSLSGQNVQNSAWSFDGTSNPAFYIMTTSSVIAASGVSAFGFSTVYNPNNQIGTTQISAIILDNSGGELDSDNVDNADDDKLEFSF